MPLFGRETPQDQQRADAWRDWLRRQHPLAIISLVLGVFSLVDFGVLILPAIVSIALGILAIRKLRRSEGLDGSRLAWIGMTLSFISLCIAVGFYMKGR
jgi:hypothetical protein